MGATPKSGQVGVIREGEWVWEDMPSELNGNIVWLLIEYSEEQYSTVAGVFATAEDAKAGHPYAHNWVRDAGDPASWNWSHEDHLSTFCLVPRIVGQR